MHYLKAKSIKAKLHLNKFQITPDALAVIDSKVEEFLNKLMSQWNGHKKRITKELVAITNFK